MQQNQNKIFQNGKQLLESCVRRLNEKQHGETGGNVALCPTVLIMLGTKSRCHAKHVKATLEDNWNNARFLQYINVVKTDDGWQCFYPVQVQVQKEPEVQTASGQELQAAVQNTNEQEVQTAAWDGYVWQAAGVDWTEALNHAIVTMLETEEKIFSRRTMIKMEYLLDASEENGTQYADLYLQTSNALQSDEQKALYLMLDQRPGAGRVEASDALLQYLVAKSGTCACMGTVWLLSNYLQSGQMIGDARIWQNYRLAADIMLLGGSRMEGNGAADRLSGGFRTVSYALVTKPVEEIAAVSLRTLLQEIYRNAQKQQYRELPVSEISEKLQMDRYYGFAFLEELFQKKICPKLPLETDWSYLPFVGVQEYRRFIKSPNLTMDDANALTLGAAGEFLNRQYLEPAEDFLSDEKEMQQCREEIFQLLQSRFTYFELLYFHEHPDQLNSILSAEYQPAGMGPGRGVCARLHRQGVYECRRIYYRKMKQVTADQMHRLITYALDFRDMYAACEKEIRHECIITGDESESVEKFYSGIAAEYAARSGWESVFCVTSKKQDLLRDIWDIYLGLIGETVYDCDFEQEVDYRMDGMDEKQRHAFVEKELRKKLEGSRRLKNSIEIPMTQAGCFYMVNARADYAKTLEQAEHGAYVLFDLSRTDCIEQLEIYEILKPQQLHLYLAGRSERYTDKG